MATDYSAANYYEATSDMWTNYHLPTSSGAIWPVTLGVTAMNKDTVWMVTGADGTDVKGEVFYTTDGGTQWTKQDIPVVCYLRRISFPFGIR